MAHHQNEHDDFLLNSFIEDDERKKEILHLKIDYH